VIGYRHCDTRFPFLWSTASQPAARWQAEGSGPANYFADTPTGAWAEFLRHEGIRDPEDLAGVRRSLWAVELPDVAGSIPVLGHEVLTGGLDSYAACQQEAARLRVSGATQLDAPSAALATGSARGWIATPQVERAEGARDGRVVVLFGARPDLVGWPVAEPGSPPERILALVQHL
jgi:hypothetical protein